MFISLKDFLSRHRAEVKDLFLTEYDEKLHERTLREEGEFKKACEMAAAMLMDGMPPNKVRSYTKFSDEQWDEFLKRIEAKNHKNSE